MEQLLNQLPQNNLRHISWRGIALIIIAIVGVVGFLLYSGGYSKIASIFGSKAGTESQFVVAGIANLSNTQDSADWMVKDIPAVFDNTGAFSDFSGTPSYVVPNSLDVAFVMPSVSSAEADTFTTHNYTSAPINIGQTGVPINDISIYAYLPESADVLFGYRTADAVSDLTNSELHELAPTFAVLPENANVSQATISLNREMKQYLQLTIDFHQFDITQRPAVYGWVITYGQAVSTTSTGNPVSDKTKLTLTYSGGPNIPTSARIELLGSDLALNPMYGQDNVNFQMGGEYVIDALPLSAGAYAIRVTGATIKEKVIPFEVGVDETTALTVRLEAFEAGSSATGLVNADLNGDGKVNALDLQLMFERYGQTT